MISVGQTDVAGASQSGPLISHRDLDPRSFCKWKKVNFLLHLSTEIFLYCQLMDTKQLCYFHLSDLLKMNVCGGEKKQARLHLCSEEEESVMAASHSISNHMV